jgi:hypothetical protein
MPITRSKKHTQASDLLPLVFPPHITDIQKHFIRELRHCTQYSQEIQLLKQLENECEDFPIRQITPELLEAESFNEENKKEDCSVEEESEEDEDPTKRAASFYYCGNSLEDLKSHHKKSVRSLIYRCPKWHLIVSPRMYFLVDRQYTLFEVLKGNTRNNTYITKGFFFSDTGELLCKSYFDLEQSMYTIAPVAGGMVFE